MKQTILPLLMTGAAIVPLQAQLVGTETFTYADGPLADKNGGTGFDFNNITDIHTGTKSDWDVTGGTPTVTNGAFVTNNTGAKREYNGPTEGSAGGEGDDTERSGAVRGTGRVFYRFTMKRNPGTPWAGASSMDFGTERAFFGMPGGTGVTGQVEWGCQIAGSTTYRTGIAADDQTHTFVALLDFDYDRIALWVDPSATDYYDPVNGSHSADAVGSFTGNNWSTAVRLASGGVTTFDDLSVALDPVSAGLKDFTDVDQDGLPASWEEFHGLDDNDDGTVGETSPGAKNGPNGALGDPDGDTITNAVEFADKTFPTSSDTDGDGLDDKREKTLGTNPLLDDTDGDNLTDGSEVDMLLTNPLNADTDGGGTADFTETALSTNPRAGQGADDPDTNGNMQLVGLEYFDTYVDGPISGASEGIGWDYDNSALGETFLGHTTLASAWTNVTGTPVVQAGTLLTQESAVRRAFHGGTTRPAAVVGEAAGYWREDAAGTGVNGSDVLYIKVNITRQAGATWSGLSLYDFGAEKVFLGVPSGLSPRGVREYAIEQTPGGPITKFSGVPAVTATPATLVARYDFVASRVDLWVNPDLDSPESSTPILATLNMPTAHMRGTSMRLGSGGSGTTGWDQLVVATTWDTLSSLPSDRDGDRMPDAYELIWGFNPDVNDADEDADNDGRTNLQEYRDGTNPTDADSDNDGLTDGEEAAAGTSPLDPDADRDGILDGDEVKVHGTDPHKADTDDDGQTDGGEIQGTGGVTSDPTDPNDTVGAPLGLIGMEDFAYTDGTIEGLTGGTYFDYENWLFNGPFVGHTSTTSDWDGTAAVAGGKLVTRETYAYRDFNGPTEGAGNNEAPTDARMGAVNDDANFLSRVVYFKTTMTRRAGAVLSVFGPDDFNAERLGFGVVNNGGPSQWGIRVGNESTTDGGTLGVVDGQTYTVVGKLDFTGNRLTMWVDPNLGTTEAANPARVTRVYEGTNWTSGVRFTSTGTGDTEWDDVVVANTWAQLVGENDDAVQLRVTGFDRVAGTMSLMATGIPAGETFHLRSSTNLQSFVPLVPAFNFNSNTPQPFVVPVAPGTVPKLFFRAEEGASPAP
ncbi:thrombospondin type 3 repeat-containing protein [Luteolibacter flavescens]|uniref:Thrombospondin type 3 repeat-containing protein n=1 Tax=Luteolibacter flavescens TaxID=1859460 RepID=A0ABT3FMX1_9BACT|nr:thrombospondin type 3 repeat-containing protein [Luteolibacter flavescens]MCW1884921.1 thrombospondin type 3 repeat-containing protein [Luteolibacter flavescens]